MLNVCFNSYGKYTVNYLYQWDKNQIVEITGLNLSKVPEVHFANKTMEKAIVRQATMADGVIRANIPNSLLQAPFSVIAFVGIYEGKQFKTIETIKIPIVPRVRPADYVLEKTDDEVYSFAAMENAIANMVTQQNFDRTVANLTETVESNKTATDSQIANIIAHNNDTESNTELIDVRTGSDGTVYESAGMAVRKQVSDIEKDLKHIPPMYLQDATVFEEILSQEDLIEIKSEKTLASSGDIVDAANYTTYIYQKAYASIIKAGGCFRIFKYNGSPSKETLLEKSADNPQIATYNVGANEFLAISFYSKNNYPILRKYEKYWLNNMIENQKSKIKVKKTASNVVNVFVPTEDVNCYIRFPFTHFTDTLINADNWKIHEAYVSDGRNDIRKIVRAGEWEMAIQIDGRDDFIGGSLHGDEIVTSIRFYADGILASSLTSEIYCNEFKAVEISDLYDPSDHTTKVSTHCKEYIFSKNGLLINQRIHWKAAYTLKYSYIAMLPILRADDKGNITSKYFDDSNYEEYDVSNDSFGGYPISYRKNVLKQTLYSEESGISAEVEILKREPYIQDAISFVSDSEYYNKLYFSMCGNNYTTSPDVDWMTSVRYQINKSSN